MDAQSNRPSDTPLPAETQVRALYQQLLDGWNTRNAKAMAALFTAEGNIVGFDGSTHDRPAEIESAMRQICADHATAVYVSKIREVRLLTADVALVCAVVGMVPPGQPDLNPAANAVQTLVAVQRHGQWYIELFHNTPAQYHGRPELAQQLTEELRQLLA